jgi:hypothetical protein
MPHPIPTDLAGWLAAGWKTSKNGNPFLRLPNGDTFVIWPQTTPPGFRARVGRSVVDHRWPDVESAKRGLYDLVASLSPAQLDALHGPRDDRQPDRPAPDRTEPRGEPPPDDGEALGAFNRNDGREELRVTLKTFEGRQYVSMRVWFCDDRGAWWPTRKGVSVRLREIVGVVGALQRGLDLQSRQGQGVTAGRTEGGRSADGWSERLPAPSARPGFDEFRGGAG